MAKPGVCVWRSKSRNNDDEMKLRRIRQKRNGHILFPLCRPLMLDEDRWSGCRTEIYRISLGIDTDVVRRWKGKGTSRRYQVAFDGAQERCNNPVCLFVCASHKTVWSRGNNNNKNPNSETAYIGRIESNGRNSAISRARVRIQHSVRDNWSWTITWYDSRVYSFSRFIFIWFFGTRNQKKKKKKIQKHYFIVLVSHSLAV